jgi:hypothetical protein
MKTFLLPLMSLLVATVHAHAEDADLAPDVISDLRLLVAMVPGTKPVHAHVSQPFDGFDAEDTVSGLGLGVRFELGYYRSFADLNPRGSLFGGFALFDTQQSGDEITDGRGRNSPLIGPIKLNAIGVDLFAGYAVPLSKGTHLEIGPYVGFGTAAISDSCLFVGSTTTSGESTGHGRYREYGGRLSLLYTSSDNSLQAAIGLSYFGSHSSAKMTFDTPQGIKNETITIDQSGFEPYLAVGLRF